eukprot:scaffold869_cov105-Isochrysis_galbana.AAC.39
MAHGCSPRVQGATAGGRWPAVAVGKLGLPSRARGIWDYIYIAHIHIHIAQMHIKLAGYRVATAARARSSATLRGRNSSDAAPCRCRRSRSRRRPINNKEASPGPDARPAARLALAAVPHLGLTGAGHFVNADLLLLLDDALRPPFARGAFLLFALVGLGPVQRPFRLGHNHRPAPGGHAVERPASRQDAERPRLCA